MADSFSLQWHASLYRSWLSFELSLVRHQFQFHFFNQCIAVVRHTSCFPRNECAESWIFSLMTLEPVSPVYIDLVHFRPFILSVAISWKWIDFWGAISGDIPKWPQTDEYGNQITLFVFKGEHFRPYSGAEALVLFFFFFCVRWRNPCSAVANYIFHELCSLTLTAGKTCSEP